MELLIWWNRVLDWAGAGWFDAKMAVERSVAFNDDALHVMAGVLLQMTAAAVLRTRISRMPPWLIVLALELINEWSDFRFELWPEAMLSAQIGESAKDVFLTMALPTLLAVTAKKFPHLLS